MNETYIVVGAHWGTFETKEKERKGYASIFVKQPFNEGREGSDYHTIGEKCFAFKCTDAGVLNGVKPGDEVFLYFDKYEKVNLIRFVENPS